MHSALQMIKNNMFYNNSSSKPVHIIEGDFTIDKLEIVGNGILAFSQLNTLYFPGFNGINRIDFIKKIMDENSINILVFYNVEFIPEPENKYDKDALKIVGTDSLSNSNLKVDLGYVPVDPQIIINKNSTYKFNQYIKKMIDFENIINPITYIKYDKSHFEVITFLPFAEELTDEIIIPSFI